VRKALVTGGAGFVGANLCEALAEDGWHIGVVDDCSTAVNEGEVRSLSHVFLKKDVAALEPYEAEFMFRGADVVYNLVGRTWHGRSMTDPAGDAHANVTAPLAALGWAREFCPDAHVIYTGTRGQYGRILENPVKEDHPMVPLDINGINKKASEEAHMLFGTQHGMKVTSLRLPNIFGPRHQTETPDGVVNWFILQALKQEDITVYGGVRDILCVCEVVNALMRCVDRPECIGRSFNVGGRGMKLFDYAKAVAVSAPTNVREVAHPDTSLEVGDYTADATAFRNACGWELSASTLGELVAETVEWYRERL
jgi:nucleoside-diphosphate-sugar epimerase